MGAVPFRLRLPRSRGWSEVIVPELVDYYSAPPHKGSEMPRAQMTTAQILEVLEASPHQLARSTELLTLAQLNAPPHPDEWSINEILAHLRGYADTRGDRRIMTMIREDSPTIRTIHPNKWAEQAGFRELDFHESLKAFAEQRQELLAVLRRLPASEWERFATITGAGVPRRKTIHQSGDALARHERSHLRQIAKLPDAIRLGEHVP